MPKAKCNRTTHAKKVRELRKLRTQVPKDLRPLFNHVIKLSIDSTKRGYCARAGQELRHAKKLAKMPAALSGSRKIGVRKCEVLEGRLGPSIVARNSRGRIVNAMNLPKGAVVTEAIKAHAAATMYCKFKKGK